MSNRHHRMIEEDARTGVAHDCFRPISHLFFITMNGAIGAKCLVIAKRAEIQPFMCIHDKLSTLTARCFGMMALAV